MELFLRDMAPPRPRGSVDGLLCVLSLLFSHLCGMNMIFVWGCSNIIYYKGIFAFDCADSATDCTVASGFQIVHSMPRYPKITKKESWSKFSTSHKTGSDPNNYISLAQTAMCVSLVSDGKTSSDYLALLQLANVFVFRHNFLRPGIDLALYTKTKATYTQFGYLKSTGKHQIECSVCVH